MVATAGGDASLTWRGTEFGQIDPTDMPRPGNGFRGECVRIKYELTDDANLKLSCMKSFEVELDFAACKHGWLSHPNHEILADEGDKVIAFARGRCIFIFNFHTTREHMQYEIKVPPQYAKGSLVGVLDTSEQCFGGPDGIARKLLQRAISCM